MMRTEGNRAALATRWFGLAVAAALILGVYPRVDAQQVVRKGLSVVPVYEGFETNQDGSFNLLFGYYNRNWEEEFDIPVGPENTLDSGDADRGQPTHFFPRRSRFVFRVPVPADFGKKEVVWTLVSNGKTEKAYGSLRPEYAVDDALITANFGAGGGLVARPDLVGNKAPVVRVEGERKRTVKVGDSVSLTSIVTDDGKPKNHPLPESLGVGAGLPTAATGLRHSWFVYRGPAGAVQFDPLQTEVWEDVRPGGNSPWSAGWKIPPVPQGGRYTARATFTEAATYILRSLAHDGGLATYEDVTIVVAR